MPTASLLSLASARCKMSCCTVTQASCIWTLHITFPSYLSPCQHVLLPDYVLSDKLLVDLHAQQPTVVMEGTFLVSCGPSYRAQNATPAAGNRDAKDANSPAVAVVEAIRSLYKVSARNPRLSILPIHIMTCSCERMLTCREISIAVPKINLCSCRRWRTEPGAISKMGIVVLCTCVSGAHCQF